MGASCSCSRRFRNHHDHAFDHQVVKQHHVSSTDDNDWVVINNDNNNNNRMNNNNNNTTTTRTSSFTTRSRSSSTCSSNSNNEVRFVNNNGMQQPLQLQILQPPTGLSSSISNIPVADCVPIVDSTPAPVSNTNIHNNNFDTSDHRISSLSSSCRPHHNNETAALLTRGNTGGRQSLFPLSPVTSNNNNNNSSIGRETSTSRSSSEAKSKTSNKNQNNKNKINNNKSNNNKNNNNDNKKNNYLYIMRDSGNKSLYKIGLSKDPKKRRKELQTGNPNYINLIFTLQLNSDICPYKAEKEIHHFLIEKGKKWIGHGGTEWFQLKEDDTYQIAKSMLCIGNKI